MAIDTMPRMQADKLSKRLARAFEDLWKPKQRRKTLARIAAHQRQFEHWWKFELATYLWDFDDNLAAFVELGRTDIVLAPAKEVGGTWVLDQGRSPYIPIELKTVGTWWGETPSKIRKALSEPGKKRLDADMKAVTRAKHRADPFSVVALLITHETRLDKRVLDDYEAEALRLGKAHALPEPVVRQKIKLLDQHEIATTARQLVWFVPRAD